MFLQTGHAHRCISPSAIRPTGNSEISTNKECRSFVPAFSDQNWSLDTALNNRLGNRPVGIRSVSIPESRTFCGDSPASEEAGIFTIGAACRAIVSNLTLHRLRHRRLGERPVEALSLRFGLSSRCIGALSGSPYSSYLWHGSLPPSEGESSARSSWMPPLVCPSLLPRHRRLDKTERRLGKRRKLLRRSKG